MGSSKLCKNPSGGFVRQGVGKGLRGLGVQMQAFADTRYLARPPARGAGLRIETLGARQAGARPPDSTHVPGRGRARYRVGGTLQQRYILLQTFQVPFSE